jgi:nucleoside-diphosphate-sugar epimerase
MRVVVLGATGNIGTSAVQSLAADPQVTSILGVARRKPGWQQDKTDWAEADIGSADLVPLLRGAGAIVMLAWLFQPTHDPAVTWQTNVVGSARVLQAAADAGVPVVVCASSVGAYSPGPKDRGVTESWPTHGWPGSQYGREKAYLERLLDSFEAAHPQCRVVRLRPGFVFKREAASEQRRLFAGPLVAGRLARPGLAPVVPDFAGLRFQAVHSADVGEACRLAVLSDARGAFNIAAGPVIGTAELAQLMHARPVKVPATGVRVALAAAWWLRLVPADPGLFDLLVRLPVMDVTRARTELGWSPRYSATEAMETFLDGLRDAAGMDTPPLAPHAGGQFRVRELLTGAGSRP